MYTSSTGRAGDTAGGPAALDTRRERCSGPTMNVHTVEGRGEPAARPWQDSKVEGRDGQHRRPCDHQREAFWDRPVLWQRKTSHNHHFSGAKKMPYPSELLLSPVPELTANRNRRQHTTQPYAFAFSREIRLAHAAHIAGGMQVPGRVG